MSRRNSWRHNTPDEAWWARARRARDGLVARFLDEPDVSMIDIGLDTQGVSLTPVLRIHIRREGAAPPDMPTEVDGITVRVTTGDYTAQG